MDKTHDEGTVWLSSFADLKANQMGETIQDLDRAKE